MFKTKKTALLTKLVVLGLLVYMATAYLNIQGQIQDAQEQENDLAFQVETQSQKNANLADAVANPDDPNLIADVAKDKLGMISPGGKMFVITN